MEEKIFNTPSGKVGARISETAFGKRYEIYEVGNPTNYSISGFFGIAIIYIGSAKITGSWNSVRSEWEINHQVKCHEDKSNS